MISKIFNVDYKEHLATFQLHKADIFNSLEEIYQHDIAEQNKRLDFYTELNEHHDPYAVMMRRTLQVRTTYICVGMRALSVLEPELGGWICRYPRDYWLPLTLQEFDEAVLRDGWYQQRPTTAQIFIDALASYCPSFTGRFPLEIQFQFERK